MLALKIKWYYRGSKAAFFNRSHDLYSTNNNHLGTAEIFTSPQCIQ